MGKDKCFIMAKILFDRGCEGVCQECKHYQKDDDYPEKYAKDNCHYNEDWNHAYGECEYITEWIDSHIYEHDKGADIVEIGLGYNGN